MSLKPGSEDLSADEIRGLLESIGESATVSLTRLSGGGNNRVYRVDGQRSSYLLKAYFRHEGDRRDRLGAEYAFLEFAASYGVRCVPRPLARDPAAALALFEFIPGKQPTTELIGRSEVLEAARFFAAINEFRHTPKARRLPLASEACLSVSDHILAAQWRIARLTAIAGTSPAGAAALHFVQRNLIPAWNAIRDAVIHATADRLATTKASLDLADRCLSPSDFGFHNSLVTPSGELCFIDFEYAGWDDPAKMLCDFFCHVGVPVANEHYHAFAQAAFGGFTDPESHIARAEVCMPIHRVKWCCIMLNEFVPISTARRRFAAAEFDIEERQLAQLDRAKRYFATYLAETRRPPVLG